MQNGTLHQMDRESCANTFVPIYTMEERLRVGYLKKIMGMQPKEKERFEACEHEDLADNVKLHFYGKGRSPWSVNANQKSLNFIKVKSHGHNTRSGPELTFGKISALAGDFYGVPEQPITLVHETKLGQISDARKQRAIDAFDTIGEWKEEDYTKFQNMLSRNLKFIDKERSYIEKDGKGKSSDTFRVIAYHGFEDSINEVYEENASYHYMTFLGKLKFLDRDHHDYLTKLLFCNYDHFQPYAAVTFEVFLALAMDEARKARRENLTPNDKNQILETAYAKLAFGCHFLGDSFSSGHMRTPRRELPQSTFPDLTGHKLCNKMHDEDNEHGLWVTSKKAQREGASSWIAYGDKMLHHTACSKNFEYARKAFQTAINEVFRASQIEEPIMRVDSSEVFDFIPYIDPKEKNNTPMFQIRAKDGKICRRKEIKDLQCGQEPIDDWTALGTLGALDLTLSIPLNGVTKRDTKKDK